MSNLCKTPDRRSLVSMAMFGALFCVMGFVLIGCGLAQPSEEEIEQAWQTSAHANTESRAFTRWNDTEDAAIPENCAKCHSTTGYRDYLGVDGSTPGVVDAPIPIGTTIECEACHNNVAKDKDTSAMPSGLEIGQLGRESACMDCHQGRQSTVSVNEAVAGLEDDTPDESLSFLNIHNKAAGPTQYGTEAKGGYEYDSQSYVGPYRHVVEFETCIACHDAHTLKVQDAKCGACHVGADTVEGRQNMRVTNVDYDGDGNTDEGLADEINTMRERLLLAIKIYAARTEGVDNITYEDRNPYFFDEDGENYATWTPRLLRAAYNYQYTTKEPGGFAHNGRYHVQLLYDSLSDLGANTSAMSRPRRN